jgi:hypothetical protein
MVPAPAASTESHVPVRHRPSRWVSYWGVVLLFVFLLLVGYLTYVFFDLGAADFQGADIVRAKEREKILADRQADDAKMLHGKPSWFSKDKGLVRVPIERAMSMTVAELSRVQPHPAYPISQSPPQPASALASYGSLAPGKSTKATSPLPTGAQPAGSPAPVPAGALPAATPAPAAPDAAAAVSGSSPAPAPMEVAPPTPGAGTIVKPTPTPAAPAASPAATPTP